MGNELEGEQIRVGPREALRDSVELQALEAWAAWSRSAKEKGIGAPTPENPYRKEQKEHDWWREEFERLCASETK